MCASDGAAAVPHQPCSPLWLAEVGRPQLVQLALAKISVQKVRAGQAAAQGLLHARAAVCIVYYIRERCTGDLMRTIAQRSAHVNQCPESNEN